LIEWEGHPTAFAFRYPYLVAFDTSFIEIRNIDTVSQTRSMIDDFNDSSVGGLGASDPWEQHPVFET
jgi:hypothetical protein